MAVSSDASKPDLSEFGEGPSAVTDADLYDGPTVVRPPRFRMADEPAPLMPARSTGAYVATITAAMDVLSARLLALIAVVGAVAMWSYAVYDPVQVRTIAAAAFSVTVLLPIVILYWKRG